MQQINLRQLVTERYPAIEKYPKILRNLFFRFLEKIMHQKEINAFLEKEKDSVNIDLIDALFEDINFSFSISNKDMKRIPSEGKLIIVANHPIGSLDALALIKAVYEVRQDIKVIANEILYSIPNLRDILLPFELDSVKVQRKSIEAIAETLEEENALILFPAAEVSRLKGLTISDSAWHKGAVYFARKYSSPILPVKIRAKNSAFFYFMSVLNRSFSRVFLVRELFNKRNTTINIQIGNPIPAKVFSTKVISDSASIKLLKKHVYNLGKKKKDIFTTEKNIIHPVDIKAIKKELLNGENLGETPDHKQLILVEYDSSPKVMQEIGRLREITFRKVGEGTGDKIDLDKYDKYYKHLVVWDNNELEIAGAYRLGIGKDILAQKGKSGFYTSSLFNFDNEFESDIMEHSIELGRSFIQKKYWNSNALHYLWLGLGAYIAHHPGIKYLFGPVSISNNYPEITKQMIVYYYSKWYSCNKALAKSKNQFRISTKTTKEFLDDFTGNTPKEDFNILKRSLKPFGYSVPILFKHYSNLCEDDGVKFLDFGVDPGFNNCLDGLILVNIDKLKEDKRERYINYFLEKEVVEN